MTDRPDETVEAEAAPEGVEAEEQRLWDEMSAGTADDTQPETVASADPAPEGQDEPRDETQTEPGEKPGTAEPTNIWASAPTELKTAYEEQQKRHEHERKSDRGRIASMQRQLDELRKAPPPAKAGDDKDGLSSDDLKQLSEDYPEIAGPIAKIIEKQNAEIERQNARLGSIDDDRRRAEIDAQEALFAERHPDWSNVVSANVETFKEWIAAEPRHVREAAQRNLEAVVDAEEAADIAGRFKAYIAHQNGTAAGREPTVKVTPQSALSDKRKRQLETSHTPQSRGAGAVVSGIPENASEEEIWNAFEQQDRQRARG